MGYQEQIPTLWVAHGNICIFKCQRLELLYTDPERFNHPLLVVSMRLPHVGAGDNCSICERVVIPGGYRVEVGINNWFVFSGFARCLGCGTHWCIHPQPIYVEVQAGCSDMVLGHNHLQVYWAK